MGQAEEKKRRLPDSNYEGRDKLFMDIDRMVNEGLGGGQVSGQTGLIEPTTTHTMDDEAAKNDSEE